MALLTSLAFPRLAPSLVLLAMIVGWAEGNGYIEGQGMDSGVQGGTDSQGVVHGNFVSTPSGCTSIKFTGFSGDLSKFNTRWSLRNTTGWESEREAGTFMFVGHDGWWYISASPPSTTQSVPASEMIAFAKKAGSATGPRDDFVKLIHESIDVFPPPSGWVLEDTDVKYFGTLFTCVCAYRNPSDCTNDAMFVAVGSASAVGVAGWILFLACLLAAWRRWRGPLQARLVIQTGDQVNISGHGSGSRHGRGAGEVKESAKERAQNAISVINTADQGVLWVCYSKASRQNPGQFEQKFAALRWVKTPDVVAGLRKVKGVSSEEGEGDEEAGGEERTEERICCVCLDAPATVRLMPCGHDEFCTECLVEQACRWCSNDAPECPVCRTPYQEIMLPPADKSPGDQGQQDQPQGGEASGPVEVRVDACDDSRHSGLTHHRPSDANPPLSASAPLPNTTSPTPAALSPAPSAAALGVLSESGGAGELVVTGGDIVFASPSGNVAETPRTPHQPQYVGDGVGDPSDGGGVAAAAAAGGLRAAAGGGAVEASLTAVALVHVADGRDAAAPGASSAAGTPPEGA